MISGSLGNSRSSRRARRIASSHKRRAQRQLAAGRRIAFVEDQIDHAPRPRRAARTAPTAPGVSNGTSALAMRALARVMRCSIALSPTRKARAICAHRQAGDDAQRERDLLGRRQLRMAADEQQAQDVVAIVRVVQPLGDRGLGIAEVRQRVIVRQRLALGLPARRVDADVAADHDQPGGGIARRAVARPGLRAPAGRRSGTPPPRASRSRK